MSVFVLSAPNTEINKTYKNGCSPGASMARESTDNTSQILGSVRS